jgi:hypothetical protein
MHNRPELGAIDSVLEAVRLFSAIHNHNNISNEIQGIGRRTSKQVNKKTDASSDEQESE